MSGAASSILLPTAVVIGFVAFGTVLALVPAMGARRVGPIRTFALAAAIAVAATHLLPEAFADLGWWAIAGLVAGIAVPAILQRLTVSLWQKKKERDALAQPILGLEVGYAGLVAHRVGDGLGMGAYSGVLHGGHAQTDVIFALAAHTIPVTTVLVLAFVAVRGVRHAIARAAGLALATMAGVVAAAIAPLGSLHAVHAWIAAIVTGLLLHVVARDLEADPPVDATGRLLDFLAAGAGILVVLLSASPEDLGSGAEGVRQRLWSALVDLTVETAPMLLIGLAAGALIQSIGPNIRASFLQSGRPLGQAVRGAVVGAPLPLCSCSVLPVSSGLARRGAAPALVVAFLIATPELGVETFTLTGRFLGWDFAFLRLGGALLVAIVAGYAVASLAPAAAPANDHDPPKLSGSSTSGRLKRFAEAFDELLLHVGAWTAVGLVAAAFVEALLPADALGSLSNSGLDVLILTVLSVPAYVCASSATPLGAVLIAKGFSAGAVLVALLLGPATNLATIAFLKRAYGVRATLGAAAAVLTVSWALALFVNLALPGASARAEDVVASHSHGPLAYGAAILLAALLLRGVWRFGARGWLSAMLSEGIGEDDHPHSHREAHSPLNA